MSATKTTSSVQCIIRHRQGAGIDARLLEALAHKSIAVTTTVDNSHAAFAELCKLARAGSRSNVVIVTDVMDREESGALFRAIERFPTHGRMWIFDDKSEPQLRAASSRDFEAPKPTRPKIDVHPTTAMQPMLRLTDHLRAELQPMPSEFALTAEELIVLTAPPPDFKATR